MSTTTTTTRKGCDFLNHTINALPIELYIHGSILWSNTYLEKRLARDDRGINIAYSQNKDLTKRYVANKIFAEEARKWITAKDSTLGDRAAVTAV